MLLLPDGTVMAQGGSSEASVEWWRLTPGSSGGYTNGNWTSLHSMNYSRLYFASEVLPDGRVFVAGAEYGNGTTNAEIYDPAIDWWTIIPIPKGLIATNNTVNKDGSNTRGFVDASSVLLSTGNVLLTPVSPAIFGETVIYNPFTNGWSSAYLKTGANEDEASLVMLPDNSISVIDSSITASERFIPSLNQWIKDATVPIKLYDPYGHELGASFLLPNGNEIVLGSTPFFALYAPSGNTNKGNWFAYGFIPNGLGAPDAPAAMLNNGKILCALSPTPFSTNTGDIFTTPTSFYEYDYSAGPLGTFTQVSAPGGGLTLNQATYTERMLDLPDGTVLFTDGNGGLSVYQPGGTPLASGKPTIETVSYNTDGNLHLTGKGFNGISQGAAYGDDARMDSNYPIVRFTSGAKVYYGRTYAWSTIGVMTGTKVVSTECAITNLPPGSYSIAVIANGNASEPAPFYGPVWVDFNYSANAPQVGTFSQPFSTLTRGTNAVANRGVILINAAVQPSRSSETMTISKPMTIVSASGPSTIGN